MSSNNVHPLVNAMLRITGEWPLFGPPPLSEKQLDKLFDSNPAFVDYFPIVDYDSENQVYLFDDLINVAAVYEVSSRYMAAKSPEALESFNIQIAKALAKLPEDDENPYTVQLFLSNQKVRNLGDFFYEKTDSDIRDTPFSKAVFDMVREHSDFVTHEKGIFPDSRVAGDKGWRVSSQKIYLCIYRKASEKFWEKKKKDTNGLRTPVSILEQDTMQFVQQLQNHGIKLKKLAPYELINWLKPLFSHQSNHITAEAYKKMTQVASFDLGQQIFSSQAEYVEPKDETDRGIWKFEDKYARFISTEGIFEPPQDGIVTIGQADEHDLTNIKASIWEAMPANSMLSWTIVPESKNKLDIEVETIYNQSVNAASRDAQFTTKQAETALLEMKEHSQRVYYAQIGIFVTGESINDIQIKTESAISSLEATESIKPVLPKYDLTSQDSFIQNLPLVYSVEHDRKSALRTRKTYLTHLSATTPFYGNKAGSDNPCYLFFSRNGEPITVNPFHPEDKARVSHELFFGPSGSGKSASVINMTLMSMAVNNPRTFIFDYGNSFKLLGDWAESLGKKVNRVTFTNNSKDIISPFVETAKALQEVAFQEEESRRYANMSVDNYEQTEINDDEQLEEEEEERSYIDEMEFILTTMITGAGSEGVTPKQLNQVERSIVKQCLVKGLKLSVEKNEPHARPEHMYEAMMALYEEERRKETGSEKYADSIREMAESIKNWTMPGLRSKLFNRTGKGFEEDADLTIIEVGNLAKEGNADMLCVAALSAIYNITALAEKLQNEGRPIEVKIDEAHLWAKVKLLIKGLVVGSKVFRKLNCWLCLVTQDVSDFKDSDSKKLLTNAEFWWLMAMSESEIKHVNEIKTLDAETNHMLKIPKKEDKRFVEGVLLADKHDDCLVRIVPPSFVLALAQTEGHEKQKRKKIMQEKSCSELEAVFVVANEIEEIRRSYQQRKVERR